jgi:hypothetical protein
MCTEPLADANHVVFVGSLCVKAHAASASDDPTTTMTATMMPIMPSTMLADAPRLSAPSSQESAGPRSALLSHPRAVAPL